MEKQQPTKGCAALLFSLATAALCFTGSSLLANGLVTPNGDNANQYYQLEDVSLYRYDCPEGVVPTGSSCADRKTYLGAYPKIRTSLLGELTGEIRKLDIALENETRTLKEADPEVKNLRALLRQYATQSDEIAVGMLKTEQHILSTQYNLKLIGEELKLIADALKKDPSEEELKRLLGQQKRYLTLKGRYQAQQTALEKELVVAKESKERLAELSQATNVKLADYMATLVVTSADLVKYQQAKANYERERLLLPELDARVTEKVAYELKQ